MLPRVSRVVTLPERGKLYIATDFQGNVRDFDRMASIFEEAVRAHGEAVLVVTGDLVHGPELSEHEWPDYLGTYYRGDSKTLLSHARALQEKHSGRVHYLLGNHEHAHVGGPVVSKFFPDEANRLEELLGQEATESTRAWIRTWPFVAVAPLARIVMTHAAPHTKIESPRDLDRLKLAPSPEFSFEDLANRSTLSALLWARTTSTERATAFLHAIHPEAAVAVYGHDVARGGYTVEREPLLCLSTSFGCYDGDELYLEWDLSEPAESAHAVAATSLRPLYPEEPRVYR